MSESSHSTVSYTSLTTLSGEFRTDSPGVPDQLDVPVPGIDDLIDVVGIDADQGGEEHDAPTDPATVTTVGARISVRPQLPTPDVSKEEAARLLSLPSPTPSPLLSVSSPSLEELLSQFVVTPPPSPDHVSAHVEITPPLPVHDSKLPRLPPSLTIPLAVCRDDVPDFVVPPRKRLCSMVSRSRYKHGESSRAVEGRCADDVGYGIRDTWVDPATV
ncbi:hypothetical protein Tco_1511237 [Tanacetum coccineum]